MQRAICCRIFTPAALPENPAASLRDYCPGVLRLANAGADTVNSIKQASEFGIVRGGQKLAALLAFITDVHALGLQASQGLIMTEAWYWDLNGGIFSISSAGPLEPVKTAGRGA
jgi:hypothetical protein